MYIELSHEFTDNWNARYEYDTDGAKPKRHSRVSTLDSRLPNPEPVYRVVIGKFA